MTEPWITLIGGVNGVGNGTVHYSVGANTTGSDRTGRIIIAGEEYTITQTTTLLLIAESTGNGTVAGGGNFETNATAVLTATAEAGYVFSHWTGDAVGSETPLSVIMDSGKSVAANFIPEAAAEYLAVAVAADLGLVPLADVTSDPGQFGLLTLEDVTSNPDQFGLYTRDQLQGLAIGQPLIARDPVSGKMNLRLGFARSADLQSWFNLDVGLTEITVEDGQVTICIEPQGNAEFYRVEFDRN